MFHKDVMPIVDLLTSFNLCSLEISLEDEQWNDGLLATIREKVLNLQFLLGCLNFSLSFFDSIMFS